MHSIRVFTLSLGYGRKCDYLFSEEWTDGISMAGIECVKWSGSEIESDKAQLEASLNKRLSNVLEYLTVILECIDWIRIVVA